MRGAFDEMAFELRYQVARPDFWIACLVLGLLAVALVGTGFGDRALPVGASATVLQSAGVLSLGAPMVVGGFAAAAFLRDAEYGMAPIVFSTPVSRARFLSVRLMGMLLAALIVFAIATLSLAVASLALEAPTGREGPLRPAAYVWAFATIVGPNVIITSAVLFAAALSTRSALATHVASVALYAAYLVVLAVGGSPLLAQSAPATAESLQRLAVIDPFGISAFHLAVHGWSLAERAERLVPLGGALLWNRLGWLVAAAAVAAVAGIRFRASLMHRRRSPRGEGPRAELGAPSLARSDYRARAVESRWVATALSGFRLEVTRLVASRPALALFALWAALAASDAIGATRLGEYQTRLFATTPVLLNSLSQLTGLFVPIALVYFAAETVWRARETQMNGLLDAAPSSNPATVIGLGLALFAYGMVLVAIAVGVVLLAQASLPSLPVHWASIAWFAGRSAVSIGVLVALTLAIHAVCPTKYVGLMVSFIAVAAMKLGLPFLRAHPLARPGEVPFASLSEIAGTGVPTVSTLAFVVFWVATATGMLAVAAAAWKRGGDAALPRRLAASWRAMSAAARAQTVGFAVLLLAAGGALADATRRSGYETRGTSEARRADYERRYRGRIGTQPTLRAVDVAVDLDLSHQTMRVRGQYTLSNTTRGAIDTVWLSFPRLSAARYAAIGDAPAAAADTAHGMIALVPRVPLQPGDSIVVAFRFVRDDGGILARPGEALVTATHALVRADRDFPIVGYRRETQLDDAGARSRAGLPPADTLDFGVPLPVVAWHATLTVPPGGVAALTSGSLVRADTGGERTVFEYRDAAVRFNPVLVAGRYVVSVDSTGPVRVELYRHARHGVVAGRVLASTSAALRVLEAELGASPTRVLRVVEVPASVPFAAFATAGMMLMAENRGFLTRPPVGGEVDLVVRRVAHEASHQWWGYGLTPAVGPGSLLIVESLAKYSEQLVLDSLQGAAASVGVREFDLGRYLAGRGTLPHAERSLMSMTGEDYLYYGKGAIALAAIADILGADRFRLALRELLAAAQPVSATSFRVAVDGLASAPQRALIDEWLTDTTLYELSVDSAVALARPGGRWEVTAHVAARRAVAPRRAGLTNDSVTVALMHAHREYSPIAGTARRIAVGSTAVLRWTTAASPASVAIDPRVLRLDRDPTDNWTRIRYERR